MLQFPMRCPRDQSPLFPTQKGALEIAQCRACHGFAIHLSQTAAAHLENLLKKDFLIENPAPEAPVQSPFSSSPMKSFTFRSVQLDYCPETHSLWLDTGEYAKIFASPPSKPLRRAEPAPLPPGSSSAETTGQSLQFIGEFLGEILASVSLFD